jgi:ABC-type antimicrobial peptide transport system permease subunit
LGVRLALGASRRRVALLVVGSTLGYTVIGSVIGLCISWGLSRWIKILLYGISEHDLLSFLVAPGTLATVAILASLFPVYRAVRIDPAKSLREG